jgi:2-keto-4-pentenoate hydratase/2-oxohepta-3-ene-1,7-dioic acid hydratase in catechol pathway
VWGYTAANDVTAREQQKSDAQWTRGKGHDTFCPIGPWIETELDPFRPAGALRGDEVLRQDGRPATSSTTSRRCWRSSRRS